MRKIRPAAPIVRRHRLLRWSIVGVTFLVILLYEGIETTWLVGLSKSTWITLDSLVLLVLGGIVYWMVDRLLVLLEERETLKLQVEKSEMQGEKAYKRLSTVFRISQMFAEAAEENEIVELILQLSVELLGAKGASFISLDEHNQPLPAMSFGEMPFPVADAWLEYLASPAVRQQCGSCQNYEQLITLSCPLLKGSFLDTMGVFCVPLRRGDQEYGVLNLYIPQPEGLDEETQSFLRTIIDETTLALEGVRLRRRELDTLRQLQAVREKTDLNSLLSGLMKNLHETLEADFVLATVQADGSSQKGNTVIFGEWPENTRHLVEGILQSVITSSEPVLLGNVAGDSPSAPGIRSLLAVPLMLQDRPAIGALLAANRRAKMFTQRQLSMLQTVAGQVAVMIDHVNSSAEIEYQTMMQERTRLAREIHDGLAQTLGFLKLKMAQMQNYLDRDDWTRLRQAVPACYETLSDAYQDARQAIDGLRISASSHGLAGWLQQTAIDFQEYSGLRVTLDEPSANVALPAEVHAQLIRIVQEALSNIRKHARANEVHISCCEAGNDLILEVQDDGKGFSPEDVPGPSQHGLKGMRERAELIGADFQVISHPQIGTTISVRLPLGMRESVL